jgi:hypothetical protein
MLTQGKQTLKSVYTYCRYAELLICKQLSLVCIIQLAHIQAHVSADDAT